MHAFNQIMWSYAVSYRAIRLYGAGVTLRVSAEVLSIDVILKLTAWRCGLHYCHDCYETLIITRRASGVPCLHSAVHDALQAAPTTDTPLAHQNQDLFICSTPIAPAERYVTLALLPSGV